MSTNSFVCLHLTGMKGLTLGNVYSPSPVQCTVEDIWTGFELNVVCVYFETTHASLSANVTSSTVAILYCGSKTEPGIQMACTVPIPLSYLVLSPQNTCQT